MKDKKILIVDFDEESLIALSNLVYEEGFQAVTAADGLSGYEKFRSDEFNLVILEPMLPKLHGFELCKKINQDPLKKTPIIVVTGIYREPSCKVEALQVYGASAFFTKPWNKEELRSKILQLLVEGKESPPKAKEEPAAPRERPAERPREAMPPKPAPREPKTSKGYDEIERELEQAVSGFVSPSFKKKEQKEKKETREIDREIDAMLKGAIGGLGIEAPKKRAEVPRPEPRLPSDLRLTPEPKLTRPEPAVKAAPLPKTEPAPKPEIWPGKREKIAIAKEIKEKLPFEGKTSNNIPVTASRTFEAEKRPFDIDKTLIEIDKIPLDLGKSAHEAERRPLEQEITFPEKKKPFFDEYVEPQKKKTPFIVVGALIGFIVIASSATFLVLKSKKSHRVQGEMVSSLTPSLPTEFSTRQNEISDTPAQKQNESGPELKTVSKKPAEQSASENIELAPVIPLDVPSAQLQEHPESNPQPSQQPDDSAVAAQEEPSPQPTESQPPPQQPAVEPVKVGSLLALSEVTTPPVLLKRVEPKYPTQAFNMGLGGRVTVNILISETGDVLRTEIIKGVKGGFGFERAAEIAIKQWKFRPAEKDGISVKVWKPMDINFKFNETPKE